VSAPKYVRPLTRAERVELDCLARRARDGRWVRRAQIVRLSAQQQKASQIAELLGISMPTVHRVLEAFTVQGLEGLADRPRSGRPPKATERYVVCLKDAVARGPRAFGYAFSSWTLARLREHLGRRCHVVLHPDSLGRLMARHGIVYRRPRHVMGHLRDPGEYNEKKALIAFLKKTRPTHNTPLISCSSTSVKFTCTPR